MSLPITADCHGKLIPAHTRQHSPRRHAFTQRFRNRHDEIVTHAVAVDVIHVFKAIQIDKHHAFDVDISA